MATTTHVRESLSIDVDGGEPVPAILLRPRAGSAVPAAVLLHGFSSRKERMADSIGRALLVRGVASVAVDLPLHGAREGGIEGLTLRNPMALIQKWRLAVREANHAIDYLVRHEAVDSARIGLAGYSLGAYLAITVAAENRLVRAVALAAGGDLPEQTPFASLVRTIADPLRSARRLAGRPLLMVNGRSDRTIRPEQARRLFDAATEPKEQRWYEGGHWPPSYAIQGAAEWLAGQLDAARARISGA
jgi:dienelactone hydrolase